jgi:hypothetical protein
MLGEGIPIKDIYWHRERGECEAIGNVSGKWTG